MKTPLNKIWVRCTFCALLFGMHACDNSPYVTDILLRANFDGDSLGDDPDKTLPGDPVGDELDYGGYVEVINSPFSGGAPYAARMPFNEFNSKAIKYIAKPSSFSGVIHCSWNGQLVNLTTTHQVLLITIDDGHGNILVELAIAGQGLYVLNNGDPSWFFGDHLANPFPRGTSKHVFMIDLNYAQKKFDLTLAGQDLTQNVFKYTNLPIFDPNVVLPANTRPTLRVYGYVNSGGSPCEYITDNVTISREYIFIPDVDL